MLHGAILWPFLFWGPGHGLFSLILLLVLLSLIFGGRRYYYYDHPWSWRRSSRSDALDTLESRYARGEIQRDEYLQKKHDLGG